MKGILYNRTISEEYRDEKFFLMRNDFLGAFAYWVVVQSPYDTPDITEALKAFCEYMSKKIPEGEVVTLTYDEIWELINEDVFEAIPEIEKLNHAKIEQQGFMASSSRFHKTKPDYDYIDLSALARNIGYMIMREQITQRS